MSAPEVGRRIAWRQHSGELLRVLATEFWPLLISCRTSGQDYRGGTMNLENDDRIKRLLNAAQQALPPDMLAASAEPSSNLNVILKAVAAMVVQAMKELTGPPEGYEIDEEVCDDGESPDAAGVGGAPPTCHWIEWRFAGNGEWDSGYSSHSLACCAAWDHASEVEGVTTADPGVTEDRGGD